MSRTAIALLIALVALAAPAAASAAPRPPGPPPVRHVFVVLLENKNYVETFGTNSKAPYFSQTLVPQGQLLTQYYGIGHLSLDNYLALVSGQSPNGETQADCPIFSDFTGAGRTPEGVAIGQGCVYPSSVETVAGQLAAKRLSWRGYMEDMGTPCRHPAIGARDDTQQARVGDQYAVRHNPFVYFHSVIDDPASCAAGDVPLTQLPSDLARASTTPSLSFITPNLCNDGHDDPCVDGRPGGLVSADAWLREWIPRITGSPAFRRDGMLVLTFDEAEAGGLMGDSSACCGEVPGPNTPDPGGPTPGPGGGRVGALVLSPFVRAGTVNPTPYNHYALLRTVEDLFGLARLGYAGQAGLRSFGSDVFGG